MGRDNGDATQPEEMEEFERKWELGLAFEKAQRNTGESAAPLPVMIGMARASIGEFLGTLLFLFTVITIARFVGENPGADFAASTLMIAGGFGLSIFVLVYILVDSSGANLNPAVSIALVIGRRITVERFVVYVIAQVLGALAGAGLATTFLGGTSGGFNAVSPGVTAANAFGGEVICTFLLGLTVFAASDGELGRKNGHTGPLLPLVIGMVVLLDHLVMIPVDGCSINPARSFATAVTNNKWDDHWVFWIGPLFGGVLSTVVWEAILRPEHPVAAGKTLFYGTSKNNSNAANV